MGMHSGTQIHTWLWDLDIPKAPVPDQAAQGVLLWVADHEAGLIAGLIGVLIAAVSTGPISVPMWPHWE